MEQDDSGSDGGGERDPSFQVHSQPAASATVGGGAGFSWDGFKSAAGELQGQNTLLQSHVARAEAEVVRLRGQVEHFRSLQETVSSDSPADAKVIQLAKKIKILAVAGSAHLPQLHSEFLRNTFAVEREKGRSARLEKELAHAQQERLKAEASAASYAKLSKNRPKPAIAAAADDGGGGEDDGSRAGGSESRELVHHPALFDVS